MCLHKHMHICKCMMCVCKVDFVTQILGGALKLSKGRLTTSMTNPVVQNFKLHNFLLAKTVLDSIYRSGLVDTLATHAKMKEFGLASFSGACCGFMLPQSKTKQVGINSKCFR